MSITAITTIDQAGTALHPLRLRILELLREPMSASRLGEALGAPRQVLNYHVKELERIGLIQLVEERRRRNCTEKIYRSVAQTFVLSSSALGPVAANAREIQDRGSASYQMAIGARLVEDHAALAGRHGETPTLTIETEIAFESAESRLEFAQDLAGAIAALARKYNVASSTERFRVVALAHPTAGEQE